jgi:very-short-patch-repair endonuclease
MQNIKTQRNNSIYRIKLKENPTKQELVFKNYLESIGVKFIFQKGFLSPFHRIVDFYIKKYRLIVEIDGGYHAECLAKDLKKDQIWSNLRFKTLRILNEDVDNGNYKQIFNSFIK